MTYMFLIKIADRGQDVHKVRTRTDRACLYFILINADL